MPAPSDLHLDLLDLLEQHGLLMTLVLDPRLEAPERHLLEGIENLLSDLLGSALEHWAVTLHPVRLEEARERYAALYPAVSEAAQPSEEDQVTQRDAESAP